MATYPPPEDGSQRPALGVQGEELDPSIPQAPPSILTPSLFGRKIVQVGEQSGLSHLEV